MSWIDEIDEYLDTIFPEHGGGRVAKRRHPANTKRGPLAPEERARRSFIRAANIVCRLASHRRLIPPLRHSWPGTVQGVRCRDDALADIVPRLSDEELLREVDMGPRHLALLRARYGPYTPDRSIASLGLRREDV